MTMTMIRGAPTAVNRPRCRTVAEMRLVEAETGPCYTSPIVDTEEKGAY